MGRRLILVALVVVALICVIVATVPDGGNGPPAPRAPTSLQGHPGEAVPPSMPGLPPPDEPVDAPREPWTLRVRVIDTDGRPVLNADLTFIHEELLPPVEGETDASGRADLRPLGAGSLVVISYRHAPARRTGLAAKPGGELSVEVRLAAGLTFTGTVFDHQGNPARAVARLWPTRGSWLTDWLARGVSFRGHTDAEGRFRIERVPPGTYHLEVQPRDPKAGVAPSEIEVQAGGAADVRLLPPHTTTLRILDATTGELVTGFIQIQVTRGDRTYSTLYSNSSGVIILDDVPPEGARVVVTPEGWEPSEATIRGGPGVVEEIRVARKHAATGRVTLVLRDAKGAALADVQVLRVRELGAPGASGIDLDGLKIPSQNVVILTVPVAESAPDGRVSLELPVGANEIRVRPKGGGSAATVVVSVEGGAESVREIDFARLGSVRVTYGKKARPRLRVFKGGTAVHPESRSEKGSVEYSGLEPGRVKIEASLDGVLVTREVTVVPGGETEVRLDEVR